MRNIDRKILIVEDEAELREIIVSLLKIDHSHIDEAEDGAQGLELIAQNQYSLVLSDIKMPRMTGLELFAEVKSEGISVPFVFLTAYGDQENIMKALRLGAFDFIKKPFDEAEMREVVNRADEVGYRRILIEDNLRVQSFSALDAIKKDEKMIQLLELKNFKKRA